MSEIKRAAECLVRGEVIAFPTETVYGVGASARRPDAVREVFSLKDRPPTQALIVHVGGIEAIDQWATGAPAWARKLAEALWPGPLTLVLPRASKLDPVVTGGGDTVGLRAPDHPVCAELLAELGRLEGEAAGIAGTSANLHGGVPPTRIEDLQRGIGPKVAAIVDGGRCSLGIESTVLLATGDRPRILRPGGISAAQISEITGLEVERGEAVDKAAKKEGARVIPFDAKERGSIQPRAGEGVIARGPASSSSSSGGGGVRWIELGGDDRDYAHALYPALAELESEGMERIYVELAESGELAEAINARLFRRAGVDR